MTNLTKLSKNLNLRILNSTEATSLKGGQKANLTFDDISQLSKNKSGGGAGLPPTLDSIA